MPGIRRPISGIYDIGDGKKPTLDSVNHGKWPSRNGPKNRLFDGHRSSLWLTPIAGMPRKSATCAELPKSLFKTVGLRDL